MAGSLRTAAEAYGLTVGSKIRTKQMTEGGKDAVKGGSKRRRGTVEGLYPHIFLCRMSNGTRECFRYNQLLGREPDRVYLEG